MRQMDGRLMEKWCSRLVKNNNNCPINESIDRLINNYVTNFAFLRLEKNKLLWVVRLFTIERSFVTKQTIAGQKKNGHFQLVSSDCGRNIRIRAKNLVWAYSKKMYGNIIICAL